jgi:leucyl/phenylalanyl-tRNA--protein transferase
VPGDPFPDPRAALSAPDGLLAAGGDLTVPTLLRAYRSGIFPWFGEGEPVLWWSPDPRAVFDTAGVHVGRTLRRALRRVPYRVTFDQDFEAVVRACAAPRGDAREHATWIVPAMIEAYVALHRAGHAHSVEVRVGGALVGGLYGVAVGRMFFAESMFTRAHQGSKVALVALGAQLAARGVPLFDAQIPSTHLASMGARSLERERFLATIAPLVRAPDVHDWSPAPAVRALEAREP